MRNITLIMIALLLLMVTACGVTHIDPAVDPAEVIEESSRDNKSDTIVTADVDSDDCDKDCDDDDDDCDKDCDDDDDDCDKDCDDDDDDDKDCDDDDDDDKDCDDDDDDDKDCDDDDDDDKDCDDDDDDDKDCDDDDDDDDKDCDDDDDDDDKDDDDDDKDCNKKPTTVTIAPAADATIMSKLHNEDAGDMNFGHCTSIDLFKEAAHRGNALFNYDLSSIPENAKILKATLVIPKAYVRNANNAKVDLYQLKGEELFWTENAVTWNNTPKADPEQSQRINIVAKVVNKYCVSKRIDLDEGQFSFMLTPVDTTLFLVSKEGGVNNAPYLEIMYK